jgi:hypothetical protein
MQIIEKPDRSGVLLKYADALEIGLRRSQAVQIYLELSEIVRSWGHPPPASAPKSKRELYLALLQKGDEITDNEIDIAYLLSKDRDIQKHFEDMQRTTKKIPPGPPDPPRPKGHNPQG